MKINEEQFEAYNAEALAKMQEFKKTLTPKQLAMFEKAEVLSDELTKARIPFVLAIAARQDKIIFRFSNFFSKRIADKLGLRAMKHVWDWVMKFCFFFATFLSQCGNFRTILYSKYSGELAMDTDPPRGEQEI
jgi:hypothetical protein